MSIHRQHINRLFQVAINRLNSFLYTLLLQGKQIVAPFFHLYSHNTNNPAHKMVAGNPPCEIPGSIIYVNTTKNSIHFICKNNLALFRSRHSYLHSFVGEGSSK